MVAVKTNNLQDIAMRVIRGEKIFIPQENNINMVVMLEEDYKELEKSQRIQRRLDNFRALQEEAIASGASNMTIDEINQLVKSVRREKQGA